MIGVCPYDCENKTEKGYCKNTGCINPKFRLLDFWTTTNSRYAIATPCAYCLNHPTNGGSGICHCTLGTPKIN